MTKKSLLKRIKVTGRGKFLRRRTKQDHFNAKDPGKKTRQKRGVFSIAKPDQKIVKVLLS